MMTKRRRRSVGLISALVLAAALYGLWTPDIERVELQRRYGSPTQHELNVDGLRVHYEDSGPPDAPVLLLLHGFGSSLQTWDPWAADLSIKFRVIRPDLPGFGLTGEVPSKDYSEQQDVATLRHFVNQLGVSHFSIVGHSLGGKIAWALAADEPDRVDALVLMAPDGFAPPEQWGTKPYEVPAVMRLMKYCLPEYFVRQALDSAFFDPQWLTQSMVDRYYDMLRAPGVRAAILDRAQQTVYSDPMPRLKQIKAPTLLLWGEHDAMIPSSNAQSYAAVLGQSQTVVLPRLGHVIQEEQPKVGLASVDEFLTVQLLPKRAPAR
jgi:pimeloyl-ACP methyl ester carboxylesterase